jgi:phosphoribosylformimino-5-aminoimidazole carboxamide ribotide isomerase
MNIIPAIDVLNGKCVRLAQGDYAASTVYSADPLEVAKQFEAAGITMLHLVDLDGARSQRIVNYAVLERIASATSLEIDFGGGLKSDDDVRIAFESGAAKITGGSVAALNRDVFLGWMETYGAERILLGADARNRRVATNGWMNDTGLDVVEFITGYASLGIQSCIVTDIALDGMLAGPSFALYEELLATASVKLIASGGVASVDDLVRLRDLGCDGAIVGKALYENRIQLAEITALC